MEKRFIFAREPEPGADWLARFTAGRDETERWYRGEGLADPPSASECRVALANHMPELLAPMTGPARWSGDDNMAHRMLSHYRPPPLITGCSPGGLAWRGRSGAGAQL